MKFHERLPPRIRHLLADSVERLWTADARRRQFLRFVQGRAVVLLLSLPVAGAAIGVWLYVALRYSSGQTPAIDAAVVGTSIVTLATALLGVAVIAFSLSLFLQQSVADHYSSQYFVGYTFDWKQRLAFAGVVCIALGQLAYGLYLQGLEGDAPALALVFPGIFSSSGTLFSLLLWQYLVVVRKSTPTEAIRFLRHEAAKLFEMFHRNAHRAATIARLRKGGDLNAVLPSIYSALLPHIADTMLRPIRALSELSVRLSERGDQVASRGALSALVDVICEYIAARRDSSVVKPSSQAFATESDSQPFMGPALEKLNELGEHFIRSRQLDNARAIVDGYDRIAIEVIQLRFVNSQSDNPAAFQLAYYLRDLVEAAARQGEGIEVSLRAVATFVRLGKSSAQCSDTTVLRYSATALTWVATSAISAQHWFIAERCLSGLVEMIVQVFNANHNDDIEFDHLLEQVFMIHRSAESANTVPPTNSMAAIGVMRQPFNALTQLWNGTRRALLRHDGEERIRLLRSGRSLANPFYRRLREAGERADLDGTYVDALGDSVVAAFLALLRMKQVDPTHDYDGDLLKTIWLPSWFGDRRNQARAPRGMNDAIDAACRIALVLIDQGGDPTHLKAAIDTQLAIVKRALTRSTGGGGYFEPRLMVRLCYCAVVAFAKGRPDIAESIRIEIIEFDRLIVAKHGPVDGLSVLLVEFADWREQIMDRSSRSIRHDAETIAASMATTKAFDTFLAETWGYHVRGSRYFGRTFEKIGKRPELLHRLIAVLRSRRTTLQTSKAHHGPGVVDG